MHELHKKFFSEMKQIRQSLAIGHNPDLKTFFINNLSLIAEIQAAYEKLDQDNIKLKSDNSNLKKEYVELENRLRKELDDRSNYIEALKFYADDINYSQQAWQSNIDYDHGAIAKQALGRKVPKVFTFLDKAVMNDIKDPAHEIGHYIEKWHNSESELKLHEFLGFTDKEFALFIEEPNSLDSIIYARKFEENL